MTCKEAKGGNDKGKRGGEGKGGKAEETSREGMPQPEGHSKGRDLSQTKYDGLT